MFFCLLPAWGFCWGAVLRGGGGEPILGALRPSDIGRFVS